MVEETEDWLKDMDIEVLPPTLYHPVLNHHCFKTALRLFRCLVGKWG